MAGTEFFSRGGRICRPRRCRWLAVGRGRLSAPCLQEDPRYGDLARPTLVFADGVLDAWAVVAFGPTVEQRAWKSALALVNWSAFFRSVAVILYFLAAAFSIFSATPSLRKPSMLAAKVTQAGSTLDAVCVPLSAPVVNRPSVLSPAQPASSMPANPTTNDEARI